jgi:hypothetical protein
VKDLITEVTFKKFDFNKIQAQFKHDLKNNSEIIFENAEKEAIEFSELFIQNGKI